MQIILMNSLSLLYAHCKKKHTQLVMKKIKKIMVDEKNHSYSTLKDFKKLFIGDG